MQEKENLQQEILTAFFENQDIGYRDFQAKLIPDLSMEMIGVRTPVLRKMAKEYSKRENISLFFEDLPHHYFEENQLHGFILSNEKEFSVCIKHLEAFLPHINNWATCDQTSPKVFKKETEKLLPYIKQWIASKHTYTKRFAIKMMMEHYLGEEFSEEYLELVAGVRSEEYYVNMMIAWYFATALAKQYDATLPYIEEKRLEPWTHNKAIQKAIESYRITKEQKEYLGTLKIKLSQKVN